MQRLSALAYRRLASPLHAASPLISALWATSLMLAILLFEQPLALLALGCALLLCGQLAQVGRPMLLALKLVARLAVPIVLINVLVSRQGLTVFARLGDLGPFGQGDLTVEALVYGLLIALKVTNVVLLGALASLTIDPDALLALARRFSFRSALTAALAVRMVPLLAADAARLSEAQRTRAIPLGGIRGRALVASAILSGSLERSMDVAATLELRGLAAPRRRIGQGLRSRLLPAGKGFLIGHRRVRCVGQHLQPHNASRHDLAFAASAFALSVLALLGSGQSFEHFSVYPRIHGSFTLGTALLAAALLTAALMPLLARKGIVR